MGILEYNYSDGLSCCLYHNSSTSSVVRTILDSIMQVPTTVCLSSIIPNLASLHFTQPFAFEFYMLGCSSGLSHQHCSISLTELVSWLWCIPHHVTNMSQNIHQLTPFEGPDQITIGNGQGLNINSGVSTFPSVLKPNVSLVLNNLLFVPSITKKLISESNLQRQWCFPWISFFFLSCYITGH